MQQTKEVGEVLGVTWEKFDVEQFRKGMEIEQEHASGDMDTDVTGDDPIVIGKIAVPF